MSSRGKSEPQGSGDPVVKEVRHAEGKHERVFASGRREVTFSNGTLKVSLADGTNMVRFGNGDVKQTLPGGATEYYYAEVRF